MLKPRANPAELRSSTASAVVSSGIRKSWDSRGRVSLHDSNRPVAEALTVGKGELRPVFVVALAKVLAAVRRQSSSIAAAPSSVSASWLHLTRLASASRTLRRSCAMNTG